jgi:hypothetical protein
MPYLREFAQTLVSQGELKNMARRAGLRGVAQAD